MTTPQPSLEECVETLRRLVWSDVDPQEKMLAFATALRIVGQHRDANEGLPLCDHMPGAKTACRSLHPPLDPRHEVTT